jgi:hypothetical protein
MESTRVHEAPELYGVIMSIQTLEFDDATDTTIARLMQAFRVNTPGQVISRAIALADQAREFAGDNSVIVLSGQKGATKIDLAN